ncbi:hypothetical protein Leryth_010857 [Lithospermum erythrorhizon]|nr:hypothetical protein Leryth_010857 [Lithospermum erythrorhizon]
MSSTSDIILQPSLPHRTPPKRFIKNQIPDSILSDASLNSAISLLPSNYSFELHKCIWRIRTLNATSVALQFPEGLLMYSCIISDILTTFTNITHCIILGDVTYGACCVDDLSAKALSADLLIHFGHSCLVPIDSTSIPCLYVFVEIGIDKVGILNQLEANFKVGEVRRFIMAGTIQFSHAIRAVKPDLERLGFTVFVPQAKPLSAGEVLGCTAPNVSRISEGVGGDGREDVIIFVADGRFHLEAFMIANPGVKTFRYDPYMGKLFMEEYDHVGMKDERRRAIEKARGKMSWGIVLGTLGRQGNPRILERLEKKMGEKGLDYTVILMSELSPARIALFEDSVEAWIQIACPRLSIDWGDAFVRPLLTPFEAEIALGDLPGWWERRPRENVNRGLGSCRDNGSGSPCKNENDNAEKQDTLDYPMDYYAQDGGEWNSCYAKKPVRCLQKNVQSCKGNGSCC